MNSRILAALGSILLIAAAVWVAASRYPGTTRADARLGRDAAPTGAVANAPDAGERVTLRFFRDPAIVPAFTVHDLDGRALSSGDWRGKVTIVNFWATWCPPCRAEIPDLIALQEKYRDRLQIVGMSEDDASPEVVKRFVAEHKMNYPVAMTTEDVRRIFPGISALPTSFIVDREGRVVQKHVGMLNASVTEQETRALAGLPVNASIEQIDKVTPAKLENAQAITIPGIDLSHLTPDQRVAAVQKLNSDGCTCGCDLTLAKCRIDDPSCGVSLPLARKIVEQIAHQ